jgi:hypothetical protein
MKETFYILLKVTADANTFQASDVSDASLLTIVRDEIVSNLESVNAEVTVLQAIEGPA